MSGNFSRSAVFCQPSAGGIPKAGAGKRAARGCEGGGLGNSCPPRRPAWPRKKRQRDKASAPCAWPRRLGALPLWIRKFQPARGGKRRRGQSWRPQWARRLPLYPTAGAAKFYKCARLSLTRKPCGLSACAAPGIWRPWRREWRAGEGSARAGPRKGESQIFVFPPASAPWLKRGCSNESRLVLMNL